MASPLTQSADEVLELGATHAALIDAASIEYSAEFRLLCEQNKCGSYGTNWMCPPAVGPFEELRAQATGYTKGLLFQTVHPLSSSFDWQGVKKAFKKHDEVLRRIMRHLEERYGASAMLPLGAGPCTTCEECAAVKKEPCRLPEKAVASCEAYGIDVAALVGKHNIPYHHGKNTISLVGCILFASREDEGTTRNG
jgi:predicted metal-binding protein